MSGRISPDSGVNIQLTQLDQSAPVQSSSPRVSIIPPPSIALQRFRSSSVLSISENSHFSPSLDPQNFQPVSAPPPVPDNPDSDSDSDTSDYNEDFHEDLIEYSTVKWRTHRPTWRQRFIRFAETSPLGFALDSAQATASLFSCVLYILSTYGSYSESPWLGQADFILGFYFAADYLGRFTMGRLRYVFSWLGILDFLTILPVITEVSNQDPDILWSGGGSSPDNSTSFLRTLRFVRFFRVLKLVRVLRAIRLIQLSNSGVPKMVSQLVFTVLSLVLIATGLIHIIENSMNGGNPMQFHEAFYFISTTVSTVGFGDVVAKTALGQMVVVAIITVSIIIIPLQTSRLVEMINKMAKFGSPYETQRDTHHIVLCTTQSTTWADIEPFLSEFFHTSHGLILYDCVILCPSSSEHRQKIMNSLFYFNYSKRVKYIVGSALEENDLRKARADAAAAVFIITPRFCADPEQEKMTDSKTLLSCISIKHFTPSTPVIMQLHKPASKEHILWTAIEPFPNVQAICISELKNELLAKSTILPGLCTLLTNLLTSYDYQPRERTPLSAASNSQSHAHWVHTARKIVSKSISYLFGLRLKFSPSHSIDTPKSWAEEYHEGSLHNIHVTNFGPGFHTVTFQQAAFLAYTKWQLVIFALGRVDAETMEMDILMNPGAQLRIKNGDVAIVIAKDIYYAANIAVYETSKRDEEILQEASIRTIHLNNGNQFAGLPSIPDIARQSFTSISKRDQMNHDGTPGGSAVLPVVLSSSSSADVQAARRSVAHRVMFGQILSVSNPPSMPQRTKKNQTYGLEKKSMIEIRNKKKSEGTTSQSLASLGFGGNAGSMIVSNMPNLSSPQLPSPRNVTITVEPEKSPQHSTLLRRPSLARRGSLSSARRMSGHHLLMDQNDTSSHPDPAVAALRAHNAAHARSRSLLHFSFNNIKESEEEDENHESSNNLTSAASLLASSAPDSGTSRTARNSTISISSISAADLLKADPAVYLILLIFPL
jgi:hypothetical protein